LLVLLLSVQKEEIRESPRRHRVASVLAAEDVEEEPAGAATSYGFNDPVQSNYPYAS
jgi:hypothetical protein